jgi:hypothetical protein
MSSQKSFATHKHGPKHVIVAALVLLMPCLLLEQSYRGSIRGKVVDPSSRVIAGAKVTAKNDATGLVRDTVTGADGAYVLAELPAGVYTVTAQSGGLSPVAQNVVVNVGLDTTADFDLTKVEKRVEQVTVTTAAPLVDDTRDVLGEVVDQKLVTDLPLNGRDFGKLVALVPGATVDPSGVAAIQSGFGQFSTASSFPGAMPSPAVNRFSLWVDWGRWRPHAFRNSPRPHPHACSWFP